MSDILTVSDANRLAEVVRIVNGGNQIAWIADGDAHYGTVRHFVTSPERYGFPGVETDIRDAHIRITTRGGWEATLPVRDAMRMVADGEFSEYDWS